MVCIGILSLEQKLIDIVFSKGVFGRLFYSKIPLKPWRNAHGKIREHYLIKKPIFRLPFLLHKMTPTFPIPRGSMYI